MLGGGLALDRRMNILNSSSNFITNDNRPWGQCKSLTEQDRFKVRHLTIHPGRRISLQSHFHRSEHWVAVSGAGRVTIDDEISVLYESQSVDIPIGIRHRIENHGKVDLHLIEVQSGAYLGDDDIVRYESSVRLVLPEPGYQSHAYPTKACIRGDLASSSPSITSKWCLPGSITTSAFGQSRANHWDCSMNTGRSSPPTHAITGTGT